MEEKKFIHVSQPYLLGKEREYVLDALEGGWISSEGKYVKLFEERFASYVGRKYGVSVNNGTNALILALRSLDLEEGSEVILPSFTIISCAMAVIYNNLIPVFVDSSYETWNMKPEEIEAKITNRTKAILMVHTYGYPCDVDRIVRIAEKNGLFLIEDFAEAIGSEYKGRKCGSFGIISCTSFYSNKLITTGEGGMCLTDDEKIYEKLKRLRNLSFIPEKRFLHYELGFNFRLSNILCAIGLAQLESVEQRVEKKIKMAEIYYDILGELEEKGIIKLPPRSTSDYRNTFWMYGILLTNGVKAQVIMEKLKDLGIETRPFFYPLHLQPAFRKFKWFSEEKLPNSEYIAEYGFYIPSGLNLKESDIKHIGKTVKEVIMKSLE